MVPLHGNGRKAFLLCVVILALSAMAAVCLHSLEEIHYLKSFFPHTFTVQEAFFASGIELFKVLIIALPLVLTIGVCLFALRGGKDSNAGGRQTRTGTGEDS